MTKEKAIQWLEWCSHNPVLNAFVKSDVTEAVTMAIEALSAEPCDDTVSRQAVLDQIYLWSKDEFLRITNPFDYLRKRINSLSPATSPQKVGHWIKIEPYPLQMHDYECSECGRETDDNTENYCRECGCRMIKP